MNPWNVFNIAMASMGILIPLCVCGAFVLVLGIVGFVFYRYSQRSKAERQSAQSWPATQGIVLSSSLKWRRDADGNDEQYSEVIYRYEVNGVPYQSQIVRAGEQYMKVRVFGEDRAVVARYPVGARVTVYFNPANPADAALER
jgi:hypothetical protein